MNNYKFSIVCSVQSALYNSVGVGDVVSIVPDTENRADPNAVAIHKDGEHLGYAAAGAETVISGSMPAGQLKKLLGSSRVREGWAILRREEPFQNRGGKLQRRFLAEAFFVPERKDTRKEVPVYSYTLGGTTAKNPKKAALMSSLQKVLDEGLSPNLPVSINRFDIGGGEVSYKVFLPGDTDAGAAAGEITDPTTELEQMFQTEHSISGRVVAKAARNSATLEVSPSNRGIEDFFPAIDSAIRRCVDQAKELEQKTRAMVHAGFPDETIVAVLDQMPTLDGQRANVPKPRVLYSQRGGSNLADAVVYMMAGKMVRLVGEKGGGKNVLIETACWLLNRPLCRVQGSSELDKMDLLGSRTLSDGSTGFELSNLLTTLMNDGVVVVDEANVVRPDVLSLLHSLTDGARSIDVPGYGLVKMGEHACVLYTLNEGYVGTGYMNPATIDRGPSILVEQEVDMATLLADAVPTAKKADIEICCKVSNAIRKATRETDALTTDAVTVRGYIDALEVQPAIPLRRALIQNVANKAQTAAERLSIEGVITSFC